MLDGSPVTLDDLDGDAFVLVAALLPVRQIGADAVSAAGLEAFRLPRSDPLDSRGREIGHPRCQALGARIRACGLRGPWCRSAATVDGSGRELAWFPATARSRARPLWRRPEPLERWRHAADWGDLGLDAQPDPMP